MRNNPIVNEKLNCIIDLMHWCETHKVSYQQIRHAAEASYELATNIDSYDCGRTEEDKIKEAA